MAERASMIPEVEHAQRRLAACLDELSQRSAALQQWATTYRKRADEEREEAKEELARFARSDEAPEALKRLQEQIDRGEISWYGALLGEADGIDPKAGAFLADRLAGLSILGEAMRLGATPQEAAARISADQADRDGSRDGSRDADRHGSVTR